MQSKSNLFLIVGMLALTSVFSQQNKSDEFKPTVQFGGRILFDFGFNSQDNIRTAGSEFRQIRAFTSGKVAPNIAYRLQIDFSNGNAFLKDVYIKLLNIPKIGGTLTVGNFKVPISLSTLTSGKNITFIERPTLVNYHQSRETGLMYRNGLFNNRLSLQLAYNTNSNTINGLDKNLNEGQNITARVTGLVIDNKEKNKLLHLGGRFSYRVPSKDELGIRNYTIGIRPESHLASKVVSSTFTDVDHINISSLELAYNSGSFSFQSEYASAQINTALNIISVPSYYAYISYFLTKEHRPYKSSYKGFSRIKPLHNFDYNKGWGAFEIALRVSSFDLSEANQGKLNDVTFGLNWYLNAYTRFMYNYVNGKNAFLESNNNAHLIRFQVDF